MKMDICENENFILTERLRNEDPEQFYTLVRMHLSFVLDLNTDDCDGNSDKKFKTNKWILPFTKKPKIGPKNVSEGNFLTTEFIAQIHPVIEFLSVEENISQEGIFRRSGKVTRQQELKLLLHQGAPINFNSGQFSVHDCASVLKNVLSELPESILTDAHYPAYCQIAELCQGKNPNNEDRLLRSLQLLILLLPYENRKFFQDLIELLHLAVNYEEKNRMSAYNLATLFTPHLLCPRRLSPEALHLNSQTMSHVVAFMIQKGSILFEIPPTLATDVRAYWNKKERKNSSPLKQLNESIYDGTAANTVFTFVDRERTALENRTNPTETALAQLYAYIQSLPESSKKRKLIKQFNKENGYGTPLRATGGKKRARTLNFGDSIKKHLSGFSKSNKRNIHYENAAGDDEEEITSLKVITSTEKCIKDEDTKQVTDNIYSFDHSLLHKNSAFCQNRTNLYTNENQLTCFDDIAPTLKKTFKVSTRNTSCEELNSNSKFNNEIQNSINSNEFLMNGPTYAEKEIHQVQKSSPPNKIQRPCEISCYEHKFQLKNYLSTSFEKNELQNFSVSNDNLQNSLIYDKEYKLPVNTSAYTQNLLSNKKSVISKEKYYNYYKASKTPCPILDACEKFIESSSGNPLKTPNPKLNNSYLQTINNEGLFSSNNTNRLPMSYGSKSSLLMATSTPAPGNSCLLTPIVDKNNSMSPITKSTKRMPKFMQETMMTPRSRKPVISLSGTDLCNLPNTHSVDSKSSHSPNSKSTGSLERKLAMNCSNEEVANESLSSTFRNYLFSRSLLTASPVDLSFSSRTDDFLSFSEKNSSEEHENYKSLPEILNEAGLSESLLYCLNGNEPDSDSNQNGSEAKSYFSITDKHENEHHVYETAL